MTAIVTSLLATGGWELVAGWILPTALNAVLFGLLVLPAWKQVTVVSGLATATDATKALVLLVGAIVGGLLLSALQMPVYRVLEGYRWPARLQQHGVRRHRERKKALHSRLRLAELIGNQEANRTLTPAQEARLARYWPQVRKAQPRPVQR